MTPREPMVSSLLARIHAFRGKGAGTYEAENANGFIAPATLSNKELESRGLPPQPADGELYKIWENVFHEELDYIAFVAPGQEKSSPLPRPETCERATGAASSQDPAAPLLKPTASSLNWSGAYILPNPGRRFVQIWGEWTVPCPKPPATGTVQDDYQCSTWIGFDGQRRYRNSTLPQIGTLQTVNARGKTISAWVQWWDRDDAASTPVTLENFPVKVGDHIVCVLTVVTRKNSDNEQYEQCVLFSIVNKTEKKVLGLAANPPSVAEADSPRLWIPGATANWIMERPTILEDKTLSKLANYGTLEFNSCVAVEAPEFDISDDARVMRNLDAPWFIRMYDAQSDPPRIVYISTPRPISERSFNMSYRELSLRR